MSVTRLFVIVCIVLIVLFVLGLLADWLHERVGFWAFFVVGGIIAGGLYLVAQKALIDAAQR